MSNNQTVYSINRSHTWVSIGLPIMQNGDIEIGVMKAYLYFLEEGK